MANNIKHQFFFPQQPEQVWEYLTRSELIAKPGKIDPIPPVEISLKSLW